MIDVIHLEPGTAVPWWRRWPAWIGGAGFAWAVGYTVFGTVAALAGVPVLYHGPHPWPPTLDWGIVAVAAPAACVTLAARRCRGPVARRVLLPLLWGLCPPVAALAFGLLMELITLVFAQTVDSWAAAANQALAAVGVVLLVATARGYRHATRGTCPRCGGAHEPSTVAVRPRPSPAPRWVRRLAYAGAAAFLPYAGMKTTWAVGGTFAGVSGAQMTRDFARNGASGLVLRLESWGVDVTALLAALGLVLLFGLIRPWGQALPRWLLLTPACVGAATLAPYGLAGIVYCGLGTAGVVTIPRGQFPSPSDALLVCWCGLGAFGVFGVALSAAAWSYFRRTRPVCVAARVGDRYPAGADGSTNPDS